LPSQPEFMAPREKRIGELVSLLSDRSNGFTSPRMLVIGGYALRAYVPFARYSRECDFALPRSKVWSIDTVSRWLEELKVEAEEKHDLYGFLRLIELLPFGKRRVKIALDFMEGEIRGRDGEAVRIDEGFILESIKVTIRVGDQDVALRVPSIQDYFILKLASGRPSDVRDIVALVWQKGVPKLDVLLRRAQEIVDPFQRLVDNLETVLKDLSDARFLDSWRGTFMTHKFGETERHQVHDHLSRLKKAMQM
jgi:hypothetical protein